MEKSTPADLLQSRNSSFSWVQWLLEKTGGSGTIGNSTNRTAHRTSYQIEVLSSPDIPPAVMYTATAVQVLPGLVGNVLLFCMAMRSELREFSYSIYLRCTSIVNSVSLLVSHAFSILEMLDMPIYSLIVGGQKPACWLYSIAVYIAIKTSPWISVAFSLDRYIAIVFPLKRKVYCTLRNAKIACGVTFLFVAAMEIPAVVSVRLVPLQGKLYCATVENDTYLFTSVHEFINNIMPCLLLAFLNGHSLFAIKQSMRVRMAMFGRNQPRHERHPRDRSQTEQQAERAAKMTHSLFIIPVFTTITVIPYATTISYLLMSSRFFAKELTSFDKFMVDAEFYTRLLYFSNFAYSFYVLVATSKAYMKIARKMLRCSKD